MQKKCRFEKKLVKPGNWTGQEFTFSPTVQPLEAKNSSYAQSGEVPKYIESLGQDFDTFPIFIIGWQGKV
jgi:hypothetical protein